MHTHTHTPRIPPAYPHMSVATKRNSACTSEASKRFVHIVCPDGVREWLAASVPPGHYTFAGPRCMMRVFNDEEIAIQNLSSPGALTCERGGMHKFAMQISQMRVAPPIESDVADFYLGPLFKSHRADVLVVKL